MIAGARLAIALVLLGGAIVVLPAIGVVRARTARDGEADARSGQRAADLATQQALDAQAAMRGYVLGGGADLLAQYTVSRDSVGQSLEEIERLLPAAKETGEAARSAFADYVHRWADVQVARVEGGDRNGAAELASSGEGERQFASVRAELDQLSAWLGATVMVRQDARQSRETEGYALYAGAGVALAAFAGLVTAGVIHHRRLSLELGRTREELEREQQLASARGELLATTSHELRNPVTALVLAAQLLEDEAQDLQDGDDIGESARQVATTANRVAQLVNELMDLARVELGALAVAREMLDPARLAQEAVGDVSLDGRAERFPVVSALPPEQKLSGDHERLRLVLRNLVDNALRYGRAPFRLRILRSGDAVEFHVEDSGGGVPSDEREAVFERFRRGSTSHGQGSGLGLYISRGVAELHSGTLHVGVSELGGADFILRLPGVGPPGPPSGTMWPAPGGPVQAPGGPARS
ncbi:MAG: CHASE3 domain-containing protein [Dehalococcoidia bacterium]|nr:CHASE3 domain-containing protein [Dehalococcoidia bacterium]